MNDHLIRFDKTSSFLLFDVETQNLCLNYQFNLPWQIAFLEAVNGQEFSSKMMYIYWGKDFKVGKGAQIITGYDEYVVKEKGVTPEFALKAFDDYYERCDGVIGQNIIGFDLHVVTGLYRALGKKPPQWTDKKVIDTYAIAKGMAMDYPYVQGTDFFFYQMKILNTHKKLRKLTLEALGKDNQIEHDYDKLHDALCDIRLNLKVWNVLKHQIEL